MVTWHLNGKKSSEVYLSKGQQYGKVKQWSDEYQLLMSGEYLAGIPTGTWEWNDCDRKVLNRPTFKNGKRESLWQEYYPEFDKGLMQETYNKYHKNVQLIINMMENLQNGMKMER